MCSWVFYMQCGITMKMLNMTLTHSLNKYSPIAQYVQGSMLGSGDKVLKDTKTGPSLIKIYTIEKADIEQVITNGRLTTRKLNALHDMA